MTNSFYAPDELKKIGFKSLGKRVFISRFARFYAVEEIEIGNFVRIDDFCLLSGRISLGNHIHISAYSALYGRFGIKMRDYSGLSQRCTLISASDDFSGNHMIGPMVPEELTDVTGGEIILNRFCQIGAGSIVLPNVEIMEGSVVGAMSLVRKSLMEWRIYGGNPLRLLSERNRSVVELSRRMPGEPQ